MTQNDGLVAVRAGGDDVDRRADQLFDALDVGASVGWQFFQGFHAQGRLAPAWHLFVHRLQADVAVGIGRRVDDGTVLVLVANADVDGFQAIQYVQLGQADARDAVDVDGATQDDGIEPAATAGTAGGGAELVATLGQGSASLVEQFGRERTGTTRVV